MNPPRPGPEQWATHRLVGIAARLTERRLNRQLARLKLTKGALDVLEAVAELEPATATDTAELLCVSRQSLGKVLQRLEGLDYLDREPAADGRSAHIRLTQAGRAALSNAEHLVQAMSEIEGGSESEFRRQLEQHITKLRNTEHLPLPRASGTHGSNPTQSITQQRIINAHLNETGAHKWLQRTGQPDPRPTSKRQPRL